MRKLPILTLLLCLSACIVQYPFSQYTSRVTVESMTVESEVYGPFSKNRMEVVFYNPTLNERGEGRFRFEINRNSFVTELWLEIEGEMERAETYRIDTGQRIYDRVVGPRNERTLLPLDPAILRTNRSGSFILQVYPVPALGKRRVVIEYYSVISTDINNDLAWRFDANRSIPPIELSMALRLPSGTDYYSDQIDTTTVEATDESNLLIQANHQINISFDFSRIDWPVRFYSDSVEFTMTPGILMEGSQAASERVVLLPTGISAPSILDTLVRLAEKAPIEVLSFLQSADYWFYDQPDIDQFNPFFIGFKNYLYVEKGVKLTLTEIPYYEYSRWAPEDEGWEYRDPSLVLKLNNVSSSTAEDYGSGFECPFLSFFYDNILLTEIDDVSKQIEAEFLTAQTVKLVLEDDPQIRQIRDEELQAEGLRENVSEQWFQDFQDSPSIPFIPYDERPMPIGGFNALQENLIIPECEGVEFNEGTIVLYCFIDENGIVREVMVLDIDGDLINEVYLSAAKRAILITAFEPAKQRDRPVGVWMSIPIIFQKTGDSKEPASLPERDTQFDYLGRSFDFANVDGHCIPVEEGFNLEQARKIDNLSTEQYDLAFEYPDLIPYFYHFSEIGLYVEEMGEWIVVID